MTDRQVKRALVIGIVAVILLAVATKAFAHSYTVSEDCYGYNIELRSYNSSGQNRLLVAVDGVVQVQTDNFGRNLTINETWDPARDHELLVVVEAEDDPNNNRGWSFVYKGESEACVEPTTTTTSTSTTTTTVPVTTTTTVPPTTTTTVPDTTTTTSVPSTTTTVPDTTTTTVPDTTTIPTLPPPLRYEKVCDEELGVNVAYEWLGDELVSEVVTEEICALPFTGASDLLFPIGIAGAGLALLGGATLIGTRKRGEQ